MKRTGIVQDPRYGDHCMGPDEPECPARLDVLYALLQEPEFRGRFYDIAPQTVANDDLQRVHDPAYIARVAATAGQAEVRLDVDTRTSPLSHKTALLAAGGLCQAIALVHGGQLDNAFALIRPPGHHAERAAARGFCLYNNVAVGARFAQNKLGLARILVVDWDLHHGNGTQHCFEEDAAVLFFSIHRAFAYPHTGRLREVGKGPGKGYTVNVPVLPGLGDGEYLAIFEALLKPVALEFEPDFILVSAGFDPHFDDPLGGMRVTPDGFAGLTRVLMDIADACCGGKLVLALEGGYGLSGLRDSVREVLREMAGLRQTDVGAMRASADPRKTDYAIWRVKRVHRRYWRRLAAGEALPLRERCRGLLERWWAYFNS
jgi:acetoin utilization deacetylase AcuC-like enzyme